MRSKTWQPTQTHRPAAALRPTVITMPDPQPTLAQSLPRRFLFNVNFVFLFALTSNTAGFLVAILMARALGPEGRGDTALFQAAVGIGLAFVNLGAGAAIFYFVSRREIESRDAMEIGLSVTIIATVISIIAVVVTALFFEGYLKDADIPYGFAIVAVPALIQLRVVEGVLRAQGRFGVMNALEIALPLCMIVSLGGTELLFGLNVPRAVIAWTLSFLPPVLLGYVLLGRDVWPRKPAGLALLVKTVRFGGQSQLTSLVQLFNYRLDVFLILVFVSRSGVGIYTVANSQVEGLLILADSVAIVLLTNITAGDKANSARLTPVVCRNTLLITAVAAVVAGLIAESLDPAGLRPQVPGFGGALPLAAARHGRDRRRQDPRRLRLQPRPAHRQLLDRRRQPRSLRPAHRGPHRRLRSPRRRHRHQLRLRPHSGDDPLCLRSPLRQLHLRSPHPAPQRRPPLHRRRRQHLPPPPRPPRPRFRPESRTDPQSRTRVIPSPARGLG